MAMASSERRRPRKRRCGRVTPFSSRKKPATHFPDLLTDLTPTDDQLEVLKCIVSHTWQLFHVSPLWRLGTTARQLRAHSHQLTSHITTTGVRRGGEEGGEEGGGEGEEARGRLAAKVESLKRFGLDGSDALHITITQVVTGAKKEKAAALEGILCRLHELEVDKEGFTSLPLLLLRGSARLTHLTADWLQTSFDCHISPMALSPDELTLLVGQYATAEKDGRGLGGVELLYSLPIAVKEAGLSSVAVELPFESAVTVWNEVEREEGDRREVFVRAIQRHIHKHFHLKLEELTLARVSTPVLHAEAGRIKFTSVFPVLPTLAMLQRTHS